MAEGEYGEPGGAQLAEIWRPILDPATEPTQHPLNKDRSTSHNSHLSQNLLKVLLPPPTNLTPSPQFPVIPEIKGTGSSFTRRDFLRQSLIIHSILTECVLSLVLEEVTRKIVPACRASCFRQS